MKGFSEAVKDGDIAKEVEVTPEMMEELLDKECPTPEVRELFRESNADALKRFNADLEKLVEGQ